MIKLAIRRQNELLQVAALAADMAGCDASVISIVEAGFLRPLVAVGVEVPTGAPLAPTDSFCASVYQSQNPLLIADIHADPRYANPKICALDRSLRWYLGVPVFSPQGNTVGVLAVLDHQPRLNSTTSHQETIARLKRLAQLAGTLIDIADQRDRFRTELAEAALLRDIHAALVDEASLPGTLKTILHSIMQVTQAAYAQVWEVREDAWMAHQVAFETRDPNDMVNLRSLHSRVAIPLEELAISEMFGGDGRIMCHALDSNMSNRRVQIAIQHGIKHLLVSALLNEPRRFALALGMRNMPQDLESQMAQVGRISAAMRPILVSKLAHERLHLLGSALAATQDGVILFKTSHPPGSLRIAYTNNAFTQMTQYPPGQLVGASPFQLPAPKADPASVAKLAHAVSSGVQGDAEVLMQRRDGSEFWAAITLVPVPAMSDHDEYFVAVIRDVTQNRADAEAQLQRERTLRATAEALQLRTEQLSRAQQIARMGTWRWQADQNLVSWSETVYEIFGQQPASFTPTPQGVLELVMPQDRYLLRRRYEQWIAGGDSDALEFRVQLADGQIRHIWDDTSLEIDAQGRVTAINGIVQDITERRETQAMLLHAEKLRSIGQLTGGIAHDFNNLLTVISINLEMIGLLIGKDHPADEMRALAARAAHNGAELTSNLLAFARRQPLKPVAVDVAELLHSMRKLASSSLGERHQIRVKVPTDLPRCLVDRAGLETALLNLLVNSRDAMPAGGAIEMVASQMPIPRKPSALDKSREIKPQSGPYISIAVVDCGVGIPVDIQEMVFEPFFTTKAAGKGTGLGLSSVIGFIRQSGGEVELISRPGEGTTMRLFLPALAQGEA